MNRFNNIILRKNTNSMKWDGLEDVYGQDDLLPMWVADMDFLVSPHIETAIHERIDHSIFGYTFFSDSYYNSIINWIRRRHNWNIKKDWIVFTPGVVPAISYAIKAFTDIDDSIIIQKPVYHLINNTIQNNRRIIINNPLTYKNGRYYMDFKDLEEKINKKTKLFILCNPHNPVGRVWTREDLERLSDICLKNNIKIISDEIHSDLIYENYTHTTLGSISKEIRDNSIICTSPSKSFNIAGIKVSNIIIPNKELRLKFVEKLNVDHIGKPNIIAETALVAAYNHSEEWLKSLIKYLEKNKNYFINYIENEIPKLRVVKPEGTYLIWVDCSKLNMNSEELNNFFIKDCKLALNRGEMFGEEGKFFQRFNIACPQSTLREALNRIKKAIDSKLN